MKDFWKRYLEVWKRSFDYKGTSGKYDYCVFFTVFFFVINFVRLLGKMYSFPKEILVIIYSTICLISSLTIVSLIIRRTRDIGKFWILFLLFVFPWGWIVFFSILCFVGDDKPNKNNEYKINNANNEYKIYNENKIEKIVNDIGLKDSEGKVYSDEELIEKLKETENLFKDKTCKDSYNVIVVNEEQEPSILDNKICGIPYLPIGEKMPVDKYGNDLYLLVQINFKDIDLEGYPKDGILEIFMSEDDDSCTEARYYKDNLEYRTDIKEPIYDEFITSRSYKIEFVKSKSFLDITDDRFNTVLKEIFDEVFEYDVEENFDILCKYYLNYIDRNSQDDIDNYITVGGYPYLNQGNFFEGTDKDECIFKLDLVYDWNIFYSYDGGVINVFINKEKLANKDFSDILVSFDTL